MKSDITKRLEKLLERSFTVRSEFYVFECTIGWYGSEIVDCIIYNCQREVVCYEIKSSVADFRSKHAKTFIGHKNYFVMPLSVYEKVKEEIPAGVGVYVSIDGERIEERKVLQGMMYATQSRAVFLDGFRKLHCIQSCRRRDLRADKEVILSSMLRCMQRDYLRGYHLPQFDDPYENAQTTNEDPSLF